ncbi:MAG: phytanoyl-CoA dioxygenase family protein [Acidobacteria bacterium]|nr:phytanoyl-CoA dioxygenase family protein [Acidobacteriota bacterium]MCA1643745.1 phytanoyl-CoA dioxygenase family protein [Acidobacteriota bacterium]
MTGGAKAITERVGRDGFAIVPRAVGEERIVALLSAFDAISESAGVRRRGSVYAIRNLLEAVPPLREVADSPPVRSLVEPLLGADCFAVRAIFFDKTPEANWKVAWHQDLSIAVRRRVEAEGFGAWTEKAGVAHVQPPADVLRDMLTLRLHLDASDETNGPLKVFPGSHLCGRLGAVEIQRWRESREPVECHVPRGGALLMKPLLLHASSASREPRHRRVVHLEFAARELPAGLEWFGESARENLRFGINARLRRGVNFDL